MIDKKENIDIEKEGEIAESAANIPPAYDELESRKKRVFSFLKQKNTWMTYILLAFILL